MQFRQSVNDFPLTVSLGEKMPSWGVSRWGGQGLRFVPFDDEGFSLRGDKQRLVYKGRRRSHRFTIIGDTSFEYDCILEREPESNTVSLLMEGAENFDFFRQPDFVHDPFLKGSYAVYKKETMLGEGTGKLCHIHRPLIIDARGRRVWGGLSVAGNVLQITIPEQWLSEAKYPVIVDPTVGTTAVGSQTTWDNDPPEPWVPLCFECSVPVNRFTIYEKLEGLCTAYFYVQWDDWEAGGRPVFYSNNNNQPHQRRSSQENWINLRVNSGNPIGWRSGTFRAADTIPAGTSIWFGLFAEYYWLPRFDYGAVFWQDWWDSDVIPNTYPRYKEQNVANSSYTFKPSMYFTYTSPAQNYVRTLTQGVSFTDSRKTALDYRRTQAQNVSAADNRKLTAEYKRTQAQNVSATDNRKLTAEYKRTQAQNVSAADNRKLTAEYKRTQAQNVSAADNRKLTAEYKRTQVQTVFNSDNRKMAADYKRSTFDNVNGAGFANGFVSFFRQCVINVRSITSLARLPLFLRLVNENVGAASGIKNSRELSRRCYDGANASDGTKRSQGFFRNISDSLTGTEKLPFQILFVRSVSETQGITDTIHKLGAYIRVLYTEAGNLAEPVRWGDYYRVEKDTVQAEGALFRHLLIFVKLLSAFVVRDFVMRRFLIAREELVLKSCITREIILDSRID